MTLDSLAVRKSLLARIIAYDAIESRLSGDLKISTAARALCNELKARTETEIEAPNDDVPLDQYVHMVMSSFVDVIRLQFKPDGGPLRDAADDISARAQRLSCITCAGGDIICNGSDYDDEIVDRGGHCIASFKNFFALAQDIAKDYHVAAGIDTSLWPPCSFTVSFVNSKPHPFASAIPLGGATEPRGNLVQTSLFIQPKSFDWPAHMSVCYLLLHEAFHVLGGIQGGAVRDGASRQDPFAEGWLDWIAFKALEEVAEGVGPAARHANRIEHPVEQIDRARQFHLSRSDDLASSDPSLSREIRAGRLAAERFLDLCQRFFGDDGEAWEFFLSVSLRLNLHAMTLNQHRQLVWKVIELIPFRRDLGTVEFAQTANRLRKFFILKDIDGFILWLVADD